MSKSAFQIDKGFREDTFRKRNVYERGGHSFWTGAAVRFDGDTDSWVLASSEDAYQAEAIGLVEVKDD